MTRLLKQTFKAWLDEMLGSPSRLFVTGELEVSTSGWNAKLTRKEPQGINPRVLLLEVRVETPPHGKVSQVVHKIPLRYEEAAAAGSYKEVTVTYKGDSVAVDVIPVY